MAVCGGGVASYFLPLHLMGEEIDSDKACCPTWWSTLYDVSLLNMVIAYKGSLAEGAFSLSPLVLKDLWQGCPDKEKSKMLEESRAWGPKLFFCHSPLVFRGTLSLQHYHSFGKLTSELYYAASISCLTVSSSRAGDLPYSSLYPLQALGTHLNQHLWNWIWLNLSPRLQCQSSE